MNRTMLFTLFASVVLSASASALEVGQQAPCVELKDVQTDGNTIEQCIRTRDSAHPYLLLEFFSTTCSDCEANLPKLSTLAAEISSTTQTRAVGINRDEAQIRTYVDGHRDLIRFPVALDYERAATRAYGVSATPTMYLLNSDNVVIYKLEDVLSEKTEDEIKALVK
jgi:peroxiredoxin